MNTTDLLANIDPNIVRMVAAALVFGLAMAAARNFVGKVNGLAIGAVFAWMFYTHNLHALYNVVAYAVVSSALLLIFGGGKRRARA